MVEEDLEKMKLNELGRQKLEIRIFLAVLEKHAMLYLNLLCKD